MLRFMYEIQVNLWTAYDSLYCEKQITSSYIQSFLISYIFDRKAVINGKQMETLADIWITGFVLFCFSEWFVLCLLLNFKLFEGRNYDLFSILCSVSFTVFSQKWRFKTSWRTIRTKDNGGNLQTLELPRDAACCLLNSTYLSFSSMYTLVLGILQRKMLNW